jgi:hypothetical protein
LPCHSLRCWHWAKEFDRANLQYVKLAIFLNGRETRNGEQRNVPSF